jgi:hypothetical protein
MAAPFETQSHSISPGVLDCICLLKSESRTVCGANTASETPRIDSVDAKSAVSADRKFASD